MYFEGDGCCGADVNGGLFVGCFSFFAKKINKTIAQGIVLYTVLVGQIDMPNDLFFLCVGTNAKDVFKHDADGEESRPTDKGIFGALTAVDRFGRDGTLTGEGRSAREGVAERVCDGRRPLTTMIWRAFDVIFFIKCPFLLIPY